MASFLAHEKPYLMTQQGDIRSNEIRCPKLGSPVKFSYCEVENNRKPCLKCISCWTPYFDVTSVVAKTLGKENLESYFGAGLKPKIVTLIELIEKARQTVKNAKNET